MTITTIYRATILVEFTAEMYCDNAGEALDKLMENIKKSIKRDEYTLFSWLPVHLEAKATINSDRRK